MSIADEILKVRKVKWTEMAVEYVDGEKPWRSNQRFHRKVCRILKYQEKILSGTGGRT